MKSFLGTKMTLNQKRQLTGVNGDIKLKMKTYFLQKINNLFDVRYSFHNFLRNESTKYNKNFKFNLEGTAINITHLTVKFRLM